MYRFYVLYLMRVLSFFRRECDLIFLFMIIVL